MTDLPDKILYIEDDETYRLLVETAFEGEKVSVELKASASVEEALVLLETFTPSLVLLDMKMPGKNGVDALESFKVTFGDKIRPVLIVTGVEKLEMLDEYKALGVIGIIHKPFLLKELVDEIKTRWRKYKAAT